MLFSGFVSGVGAVVRSPAAQCCVPETLQTNRNANAAVAATPRVYICSRSNHHHRQMRVEHLMGASIALHARIICNVHAEMRTPLPSSLDRIWWGRAPMKLLRGIAIRSLLKWLSGCHGKTIYNDRQHIFGALHGASACEECSSKSHKQQPNYCGRERYWMTAWRQSPDFTTIEGVRFGMRAPHMHAVKYSEPHFEMI